MARDGSFQLTKWYFDTVSPEGRALIGYVANVAWGPLSFSYASLLDGDRSRSSLRKSDEPKLTEGRLAWHAEALGVSVELSGRAPALPKIDVMRDEAGAIVWHNTLPVADASFVVHGETISGLGYGEVLTMSIAPWNLGWKELRWGRFLSARHHVVWTETLSSEGVRRNWVFENGDQVEDAHVGEQAICCGDDVIVQIEPGTVLREGQLGKTVLHVVPNAAHLFPGRLLGLYECKWLSRATHVATGEKGWVIHEVVRWP